MTWLDQLSPRSKRWIARTKWHDQDHDNNGDKEEEKEFQIVHFPDRPTKRVQYEDIPTEEECRKILEHLFKPDEGRGSEDAKMAEEPPWEKTSPVSTTSRPALQVTIPDYKSDDSGIPSADRVLTARAYSPPHPPTVDEKRATASPKPTATDPKIPRKPLPKRLYQRDRRFRKSTSREGLLRSAPPRSRPAFPPPRTAPRSATPVQRAHTTSHEQQPPRPPGPAARMRAAAAKAQAKTHPCSLCRQGAASPRGLCGECEDEFRALREAFAAGPRHSRLWRPLPPLPPEGDHVARHCCAAPRKGKGRRGELRVAAGRPAPEGEGGPRTPASGMSTPRMVSRFHVAPPPTPRTVATTVGETMDEELDKETKDEDRMEESAEARDLYDEDWAEYYFDERNFRGRGRGRPETPRRDPGRERRPEEYGMPLRVPQQLQAWV